jgi:signal peptidase
MKKKILSWLVDVLLVFIILTGVVVTVISLNSENGIPTINGNIPLSVQSESMKDTLNKGDLIIDKKVDVEDLKVGDIISFLTKEQDKTVIVTHRIIEIKEEGGYKSFITKGDNNPLADENDVTFVNVIGKYSGTRIPYLGLIIDFLKSQIGFLLFIIVPLFVVFIYLLYNFITIIIEENKKKLTSLSKKDREELLAEAREQAKLELLKEQEEKE